MKRRRQRQWKPIAACVLRIEVIDKKDSNGVLEPRRYKLDLVFQWQGIDWHRSWIFPRTYDLPEEGDILQLRYHPKKEDFQLDISPAEKQEIRRARLVILLVSVIVIFVLSVLFALLFSNLPQEFTHSEISLWLLFTAPFLAIYLIVRIRYNRRLRRKIELGELQPITAQVYGFRKDSEGDVYAFCLVRFNGREKEVQLTYTRGKQYKVGQWVTPLFKSRDWGDIALTSNGYIQLRNGKSKRLCALSGVFPCGNIRIWQTCQKALTAKENAQNRPLS